MKFYDHPGMIHPGVRTYDPNRNKKQYYVFYQWVCFVLFLQVSSNNALLLIYL